ncbi:hypothetical protein QBC40DRAFT_323667 [Triangularia verruculosa]|uniref:Uncharacterized protein n=1 Tax=Triangularia verruculosa TaxID=2587418 RepID=A0AAN6XJF0_9PEZI|nr:hypothetical protein QBC40DRAFT_323667 [Triangularia verruculosa]
MGNIFCLPLAVAVFPLGILAGSLSAAGSCVNNGLALFSNTNYRGDCQGTPHDALDNTNKPSCVDINFSTGVYSLLKSDQLKCCFLYEQPCPNRESPFYPQRPNLLSQRVFVGSIPDLSIYGWGGTTIKSVVCPDAETCAALQADAVTTKQQVWVEQTVRDPYSGQKSVRKVLEENMVSLRPYWLDLQLAEGHENAI